ncbi:MAG: enoyl-CoA hydratase/isomerase family protein [Acidobacteria bacterium]|nr:enoyl-CoA hydratase/isomerase family protein [Acidobacteriota bacterium]
MSDVLLIERRGHTTIFTLNRPHTLNAYNEDLTAAVADAMADFDADPDQYIGIITGAGDKAFCSGADLINRSAPAGRRPGEREDASFTQMFGIGRVGKPMIAAVNGLAVGGGVEIALNCDFRVASDQSWFGLFEPKRGILPGVAVHLLPRNIAFGDAAYALLTAERIPAEEALRMGIVQKVVPHDELLDTCLRMADEMAKLSQLSLQAIKRVMGVHKNALIREGVELYAELMARIFAAGDVPEGMAAFAEKRDPVFKNRWSGQ